MLKNGEEFSIMKPRLPEGEAPAAEPKAQAGD
jgi:hypothetical protein